jgi:hypothetical protein
MEFERLEPTTTTISKKEPPHTAPPQKAPAPTPDQQILHLQHTIGNRAVQRIIQAKLQVSQPNDVYEREADHIAERVVSMPAPSTAPVAQRQTMPEDEKKKEQQVQMKPLAESITPFAQRQMMTEEEEKKREQPIQTKLLETHSTPFVHRQATPEEEEQPVQMKAIAESMTPLVQRQAMPEEEKKEEQLVQTKSTLQRAAGEERADAGADIEQQLGQSRGKGNPLPDAVRSYMEPRFGADFSGVRIHTGSEASMLNRSLSAQAFTVGQDIYYGSGKSPSDLSLTAHELTHVVQQTGAVQAKADTTQQVQRTCAACAAGGPPCPTCQKDPASGT